MSKNEVRQYYSELSKTYDKARLGSLRDQLISDLQVKWTIENLPENSFCLEIGSGTGRVTQNIIRKASFIVASDGSLNMIKVNRSKTSNILKQRIDFVLCDASNLPFRSESFTRVIGARVFWHIPQYERALDEAVRVLKEDNSVLLDFPIKFGAFFLYSKLTNTRFDVLTEFITRRQLRRLIKEYGAEVAGSTSYLLLLSLDNVLKKPIIRYLIKHFENRQVALALDFLYSYYLIKINKKGGRINS